MQAYGRKQMITRSDIDTQTEGAKSMDSYHKSIRNKRYRQRNRSMVRATWAALASVLFAALAATSGCSTQSPAPKHNEELAGSGEFVLTPEGRVIIIR
jgi:hypothetical protein